jgi:hypothetical protein
MRIAGIVWLTGSPFIRNHPGERRCSDCREENRPHCCRQPPGSRILRTDGRCFHGRSFFLWISPDPRKRSLRFLWGLDLALAVTTSGTPLKSLGSIGKGSRCCLDDVASRHPHPLKRAEGPVAKRHERELPRRLPRRTPQAGGDRQRAGRAVH